MEFITEFVPSVCKTDGDKPALFSGSVKLRKPTFDERYIWIEKFGLEANKIAEGASESEARLLQLPLLRKAVKDSAEFFKDVSITKLSDGQKYSSFEALSMDSDCDSILFEIATLYIGGFRPGEK